ncbi:MAG: hypothetical protein ABFS17_14830, partial [Chloroflexota bacterium]
LTGILVGVLVLVIAAIGMFFLRKGETGYLEETTPDAVVLNYVYALQTGDYQRAYQYLPAEFKEQQKPSFAEFKSYFNRNQSSSTGITIISVDTEESLAWVNLETVQSSGGLFGGIYRSQENAQLILDADENWKIIYMPYQFWGWDWFDRAQI